jgi:hypothetical protein
VILESEPLLIPIISSGSGTAIDNRYQQWHICNGSEIITDGSFKQLQMTFSAVVINHEERTH